VHRFDFDGRYAYISPTADGYVGNFVMILDLKPIPPARKRSGRWWIPGQHAAGGEEYPWGDYVKPRCHHPLRMGDRLYVSYWHHGFFILDIADLAHPRLVSAVNLEPGTSASHAHLPADPAARSAGASWWWPTRMWPSCAPRRRHSPGSTTSPTNASRCRSRPSRSRASTGTARRSRG
jgi:hypothetical protein